MKVFKSIYLRYIALCACSICLAAISSCGGKKSYMINGTVEGLGTQNVTAVFHDGNSLKKISTNAVNSAFHLEGYAEHPVVIELYDNQYKRIGCIVAQNGDEINVKFKATDRSFMEQSGNKLGEALSSFVTKNASELNNAIERQICAAPTDELSVILAGYYYDISGNPHHADSILSLIDNAAIIDNAILRSKYEIAARLAEQPGKVSELTLFSSADSTVSYKPSDTSNTLFIFTDIHTMPDSIIEYADSVAKEIRVASIRMSIDTFGWHKDTRRFSKKVDHLWALGGVANDQLKCFTIPQLPYFVVVDTAYNQIYRGTTLPVIKE